MSLPISTTIIQTTLLGIYYLQCTDIYFRGTTPHLSSKYKADGQKVVTVGFHARNGTRYLSIHAHGDGTWKEFLSRAGKAVLRKERDGSQRRAMQGRLSRSTC